VLKKESKILSYFLALHVVILSCNFANTPSTQGYVDRNFKKYKTSYEILNDSIAKYISSDLTFFIALKNYDWELDSMIIISQNGQLLVGTINISFGINENAKIDQSVEIYGKYLNNVWYFFRGLDVLAIPRKDYGKDGLNPLTLKEISDISRKYLLANGIKYQDDNFVINDDWIKNKFYKNGYNNYSTTLQYDSVHWHLIMDKWNHRIDTNEYKPSSRGHAVRAL